MKNYKFLISGGGTGGHIYPAISIADELTKKFKHSQILFVGSNNRMEMKKVPEKGYEITFPSFFKIFDISSTCSLELRSNEISLIGLLNNSLREAIF